MGQIMVPYRFRPFTAIDVPMVERWLRAPEVMRWWGDPAEELALLTGDLHERRMRQCIVECRERPFAYVQTYEAHAWPQAHLQHLPVGAQVIDAFIGEADMLACGHGSAFLRLFAIMLINEGARVVAVDPDVQNLRARRAYARAGFSEEATIHAEGRTIALMVFRGNR